MLHLRSTGGGGKERAGQHRGSSHQYAEVRRRFPRDRQIDFATVRQALVLIALGYVKKVAVADNLAAIVEPVFDGLFT